MSDCFNERELSELIELELWFITRACFGAAENISACSTCVLAYQMHQVYKKGVWEKIVFLHADPFCITYLA